MFKKFLNCTDLKGEECVFVGDRIDKDLKPAKELGMKTVRILISKYGEEKDERNVVDYEIKEIKELLNLDLIKGL